MRVGAVVADPRSPQRGEPRHKYTVTGLGMCERD